MTTNHDRLPAPTPIYTRNAPPPEPCLDIKLRIREIVIRSGMGTRRFANMIGINERTLATVMRGDSLPSSVTVARICLTTHTSADWLLFGRGEKEMPEEKGEAK